MSITVKLGELAAAHETLKLLAKSTTIPFKASYHIGRVLRKASEDLETYYEKRNAMVTEFGVPMKDDEGKPVLQPDGTPTLGIKVDDPAWPAFKAKLDELDAVEVTIDAEKIGVADMGDKPVCEPGALIPALWLFKD